MTLAQLDMLVTTEIEFRSAGVPPSESGGGLADALELAGMSFQSG